MKNILIMLILASCDTSGKNQTDSVYYEQYTIDCAKHETAKIYLGDNPVYTLYHQPEGDTTYGISTDLAYDRIGDSDYVLFKCQEGSEEGGSTGKFRIVLIHPN